MSDAKPGTTATVGYRGAVARPQGLRPVRVQCSRCPNKTLKFAKIHTAYHDPRKHGDYTIYTSYWCLSCLRGANVEEDDMRTVPSVNVS